MNIPADLKYTKSDEWVRVEGNSATAGISDFAQNALSDIVYVEYPSVGDAIGKGEKLGSVESVKAASDINMPIGGTITAVNDLLTTAPEKVNADPYGDGWMVKFTVTDAADLNDLMDAAGYEKYCAERAH